MEPDMDKDVVVVGSGAAAMTAAIVAAREGLEVLLVEKSAFFGGTSALSGGVAWIPDNQHMSRSGEQDSRERALRYIENVVGKERLRPDMVDAFVEHGKAMVAYLDANTEVKFNPGVHPDYRTDLDGSVNRGRSIVAKGYDGRLLGPYLARLRMPPPETLIMGGMMVNRDDLYHLTNQLHSLRSFLHVSRRVARYFWDRLSYPRGTHLELGNALIARMLRSAVDAGVILWHDSPAKHLVGEGGAVTGIVVEHEGRDMTIRASRGVVLGTGGFAHDEELKRRLIPHADQHETLCPETNNGDGIRMALSTGAKLGGNTYQNFLGTQVTLMRDRQGKIVAKLHSIRRDRVKPGFVLVTRHGKRFANEGAPYNDLAHATNDTDGAIPSFLVCDHRRLRRYGLGLVRPGPAWLRPLGSFLESGHLVRAGSIAELAIKIGVDPNGLEETVRRNNAYAKTGKDPEFGKGDTVYDRWQGDPASKPNPNIGPIEEAPFYAVTVWPGNLGTFCGIETDARARVLDAAGAPIAGLYACGLDMHPPFSGTYPGGGSSIGPGMTFGYLAGQDLAHLHNSAITV